MRRYGLRDDQWDRIKDSLPGRQGHVGGTAADNRLLSHKRRKVFEQLKAGYHLKSLAADRAAHSE